MTLQKFTSEFLKEDGPIIKVLIYQPEPVIEAFYGAGKEINGKEAKALIDPVHPLLAVPNQ